jgi:hypothetical protein
MAYIVGERARVVSTATSTNFVEGTITAYSGTTLTVNVDNTGGSGTIASWNISVGSAALSLTTTGSSGAATLTGGVLNIPQYAGSTPNYGTPVIVTTTSTITGSAIVYVVNDGVTVTLPLASTAGQILVILDGTSQSVGITIARQGSNTITDSVQGLIGVSSVTNTQFRLVSDGAGKWYNF